MPLPSPVPVTVRPYTPADRQRVLALGLPEEAIDARTHRLVVLQDGAAFGVAIWHHPDAGGLPWYDGVLDNAGGRLDFLYRAAVLVAQQMLAAGFRRAYWESYDPALVAVLVRDLGFQPEIIGRDGDTQQPSAWRFTVDVAQALRRLRALPL